MAQKVANHLGFFYYQFCCQELSKIAQSGHTVWRRFQVLKIDAVT